MRRLIRSRLNRISSVCICMSEFTRCPKLPDFTLRDMVYLNQTRQSVLSQTFFTENRFSLCLRLLVYFICMNSKDPDETVETVSSELLLLIHATSINSPCPRSYIVLCMYFNPEYETFRVKSGVFGQTAKFGQTPLLFHSSIIGIKNKLSKQTVEILMRRLIRSRLIRISTVCKCVSEFT